MIRGYGVHLDWSAAGFPMTVYLTITAVQGYQQRDLVDKLALIPELEGLDIVTGAIDLLARLRVRDHLHLRQLLMERIWQIEGVQRTETSLSLVEIGPRNLVAELLSDHSDDLARKRATRPEGRTSRRPGLRGGPSPAPRPRRSGPTGGHPPVIRPCTGPKPRR